MRRKRNRKRFSLGLLIGGALAILAAIGYHLKGVETNALLYGAIGIPVFLGGVQAWLSR